MPTPAEDVVLANSAAFSAMDVDGMLALYATDCEVVDRRRVSMGTFSGHDELRAYYLSIFHSAAALREDLTILRSDGDRVAAHCELWGRLASDTTGSGITVTYGLAIEVRDGKIAHLEIAEDGEHALELSGLAVQGG
jgi:ketosteroid isomerase-like protein